MGIFKNVSTAVMRTATKVSGKVSKASPEILLVAGVAAGVATVVTACKQTMKADEIIEQHEAELEKIHTAEKLDSDYAGSMAKGKDVAVLTMKTAVRFARLYAVPIALGALTAVCIFTSFGILKKRNVALTAAYAASEKAFKTYRSRVVDRFGQEVDEELVTGRKLVEREVTDKDGKKHKEKGFEVNEYGEINENDLGSPYAFIWGPGNPVFMEWDEDANDCFISVALRDFRDKFFSMKELSLYDVTEHFRTSNQNKAVFLASGWIMGNGDSDIDFRIRKIYSTHSNVPYYIIDPNVDGYILDKV